MNEALQPVAFFVSLGGAIGAVVAAVVEIRNGGKIDAVDSRLDILSGRVDERGETLRSVIGALLKTP